MELTLAPRHRKLISGMVKSGVFNSPQAVVGEALRLLETEHKSRAKRRRDLIRSVKEGFRQIERGESAVLDAELLERLRADAQRLVAARRRKAS